MYWPLRSYGEVWGVNNKSKKEKTKKLTKTFTTIKYYNPFGKSVNKKYI